MSVLASASVTGTDEVTEFHRFLGEQLQEGVPLKSPEQAVAAWRRQRPVPPELAEDVADIREAIDAMRAGETARPAEEIATELRKQLALAARSGVFWSRRAGVPKKIWQRPSTGRHSIHPTERFG